MREGSGEDVCFICCCLMPFVDSAYVRRSATKIYSRARTIPPITQVIAGLDLFEIFRKAFLNT